MSYDLGTPSSRVRGHYYAILLGALALITSIPLVFDGFATGDSMQYAAGLEGLLRGGFGTIGQAFNGDMSLGYYAVCFSLAKVLGGSVSLSALMNVLSATASVVLQLLLFFLFTRLTGKPRIAFFTCLAVLLAPTVWFHSHYGHPILLTLSLFVGSLIVLDRIVQESSGTASLKTQWALFTLLATLTALIRLDIILAYPAFFGLLYFRKAFRPHMVLMTFGSLIIAGILVMGLHWVALGKIETPGGGALAYHVSTKLGARFIVSDIFKNLVLLVFAANVFMIILSVIGWFKIGFRSPLGVFVLSWVLPWAVFLPFKGMDYARICLPAIPPLMLMATLFVDGMFQKGKAVALLSMLVLAQLASVLLYYPVEKFYSFRHKFEGRIVASVPLGFLPTDQYYRQRMIRLRDAVVDKVAQERNADVLIISDTGTAVYEYWLYHDRTIVAQDRSECNGVVYRRYATRENVFYAMDTEFNSGVRYPIGRILLCLDHPGMKVHVAPFATEYAPRTDSLYLSRSQCDAFVAEAKQGEEKK